jgi:hypothetical protein
MGNNKGKILIYTNEKGDTKMMSILIIMTFGSHRNLWQIYIK